MVLEKIPFPRIKILLIEDNPGDARLIEELLRNAMDFKHDLIFTPSLSEGLEYIDKEPLDVILLDLSLPDSNGFDTIFRTREKAKNIPIVVLTGLNDENYARKAVQAGAQDYLIKGQIDSNPLVRSIYHAIDRHKMMQTIESLASTLQQSEAHLKKIINKNADSIVIVDNNGIVSFVNPAAEKFFGRKKSKFIGEFFNFPTADSDKTEIEIVREDGQIVYAEMRSVEIEWEKSKAYLLTLRDISERKQFEMSLKESEEKYRIIVENSLEGVWAIDSNSNTTFVNQRMAEILGYSVDEMIGRNLFDFMDDPRKEEAKLYIERRKKGIKETHDFEFLRKDGALVYTRLETSPLITKDGLYNGALAYVADITEKKKAEEKLQYLAKLVELISEAILSLDINFNIISWNKAAEKMYGWKAEEVIGKNIKDIIPAEALNDKRENILRNFFEKGYWSGEGIQHHKDGTPINVLSASVIIKDRDGKNSGMVTINRDITERKKVEKQLVDLAKFPSENPNPVLRVIKEKVLYINNAGQNAFDTQEGNSIPEMLRSYINDSFSNNLNQKFDVTLKNKIYSFTITPINDKGYANLYGIDITELKKAEEKLKESERKYRDLFENSPNPIIILNLKGDIIDVNSSVENLFGFSKSEIISQNYKNSILFPTNYLDLIENAYKKILRGNIPELFEIELLKKNGDLIWINLNFSLIKQLNETLIHILIQNITEVKSSKLKLKKLKQALQELDALIESSPLPIFLIDAKGKILRANEEAGLLVRYSKTELVNSKIFDLFIQDSLEIAKKYYKESIYISSINKRIEMSIKRKDRKIIDVEITSKIIKIEDQIVIQSIFSDISERKEFEINRQSLLDQLYISLEFKSKFLTSTSHELRTPLNSILGFSQLLLEESYGKLNIEQKDFIKDINSAGSHLLTLINSILDMSRIEAGKLELYREKFRLKETIENINSIIKPLYEKKNLIFNIKGINDSDEIIADILRFKQILFNLLSNAINFTNEGSITLYGIQRTDHWEFQVQDTGIGIKKEDFILIFKEFGRINNDLSQEVQGAGLGLALTKRLVQLHGGEIWFESEFGKGTIFYITIPMV